MAGSKPRHYVIVVHGIGEQKVNETTTEVVHRFAEVRHDKQADYYKNLLPSYLSALSVRRGGTGHGWSEFNGIPVDPDPAKGTGEFDGRPATKKTAGLNFRFVDLHWAPILQRHQKRYASSVDKWAKALLERIDEKKGMVPKNWIPPWAPPMLDSLVDILLPVKRLLARRYPDLVKRIFDDFLGDVHLYGDYARTRGRAVRHFHVILDEIHFRDFIDWYKREGRGGPSNQYQPPEYTIIAHSLGSVLSFDALVYAHARKNVREAEASSDHDCPSLPFPGYMFDRDVEKEALGYLVTQLVEALEQLKDPQKREERRKELAAMVKRGVKEGAWHDLNEQLEKAKNDQEFSKKFGQLYPQFTVPPPRLPLLLWRNHVKNFITLGSPIDKYHVLWSQNYEHMGLKTKDGTLPQKFKWWQGNEKADSWLEAPKQEIVHYNLCDEQDPVGHHLDVAMASENYYKIFNKSISKRIPITYRDIVFRRYAVPGLAHVKYWKDSELFKGIVQEIIAKNPQGTKYFAAETFREPDKAIYRKALTWAYFRIPFAAAMITGLLLSYGILGWAHSGFRIDYLAAILAAFLLWTRPRLTEKYAEEARPEGQRASWWQRWRWRRSIFAHLVAGAIEWRRILTRKSEGKLKLNWGFLMNAWWRYLLGLVALALSTKLAALSFPELSTGEGTNSFTDFVAYTREFHRASVLHIAAISLFMLSVSYLGTMFYVYYLYEKARRRKRR